MALLVAVVQVVRAEVVEIDGLLHEAEPKEARVKVSVSGCAPRDGGDAMDAGHGVSSAPIGWGRFGGSSSGRWPTIGGCVGPYVVPAAVHDNRRACNHTVSGLATIRCLSQRERQFLADRRVASLATADRGAVPHVVPVCFAVAGQSLYVTIAAAIPAIEAENQAASPGGADRSEQPRHLQERPRAQEQDQASDHHHQQPVRYDLDQVKVRRVRGEPRTRPCSRI
jgi:hypothetical protein